MFGLSVCRLFLLICTSASHPVAVLAVRKDLVVASMTDVEPAAPRATDAEPSENLFTRELVQVLAGHGLQLEQLADQVGIQPATVQRFQTALTHPRLSPVLSSDELELLETTLLLDATEQGHLQAALLATALQRLLKDQLGPIFAQQLTEQLYPALRDACLRVDPAALGEEKRGQDHDANEDDDPDSAWAVIWEAIDAANLALQLSRRTSSTRNKIRKMQEARLHLDEALEELDLLPAAIKSLPL